MLKFALTVVLALLLPSLAHAQANNCLNGTGGACPGSPLTGATISANGYNFAAQGQLFAGTAPVLQFANPFSVSLWVKGTVTGTGFFTGLLTNKPTNNVNSFAIFTDINFAGSSPFVFSTNVTGVGCEGIAGFACTVYDWVNDGNWHNVCGVSTNNQVTLYIDGVLRSQSFSPFAYQGGTNFWTVGFKNTPFSLRDIWVWNVARTPGDCQQLYAMGTNNLTPNSGPLNSNVVAHWTLDASTSSSCASGTCYSDSGPNNLILTNDAAGPAVTITSPTAGTYSGIVNLQASCIDAAGCTQVLWTVDSTNTSTQTVSPYTFALNTAGYSDGSHVIGAVGTNAGGVTTTATPVTITTSNGGSGKSVYISGTGSDSNNCLSPAQACATMAKANTLSYKGGDSVLFDAQNPISIASVTNSTALVLAGPNAKLGDGTSGQCTPLPAGCAFPVAQNVTSTGAGFPITIGTYNTTGTCSPLAGQSGGCATITVSGNSHAVNVGVVNVMNLSYVTVQNLKIVGTGQAQSGTQGFGIGYFVTSGTLGTGAFIQNNEVIDFNADIIVAATANLTYPNFGSPCGITVQDNYVHGSTSTYNGNDAGIESLNTVSCAANAFGSAVISNYVTNTAGVAPGDAGSGIVSVNSVRNYVDNFNVTSNGGANNTHCGGPYGNWWYQTTGALAKGNEVYGWGPTVNSGCDNGSFDIDHDDGGITIEYNYTHKSWGPALNMLLGSDTSGFTLGNHTIRYNIFENGYGGNIDPQNGMVGGDWNTFSATQQTTFYNNILWAGLSGTVAYFGRTAQMAGLGIGCYSGATKPTIVANNIFATNGVAFVANSEFVTYAFAANCTTSTLWWRGNAYYPLGSGTQPFWRAVNSATGFAGTNYTTYSTWAAAAGETGGLQTNPNFLTTGGGGTICYAFGSGIPGAPGAATCPSTYQLTNPGSSALIGTGTDLTQAPYSLTIGTIDYYTNALGNGVGTGYNMGADGAHH